MDKYEETMKNMMSMPEEEQMKQMNMLKSMCVCASCPSYTGTGETALLFCSAKVGKSQIITEEKGCTCPGCPVTGKLGLTKTYFCTRGAENAQRGMSM